MKIPYLANHLTKKTLNKLSDFSKNTVYQFFEKSNL
ncbi:hypothetical protein SAMN06265379_103334 [Saccharicrinis carchari]|uniref:Uncharacterized protein n=1 Tax=Saccharicrinis carchari TaxID=1168039 RepID=A0A521CNA9_SACCC|nr:hypothetical protein SAMN06265379_103334 [Saccharicrinis carchari]